MEKIVLSLIIAISLFFNNALTGEDQRVLMKCYVVGPETYLIEVFDNRVIKTTFGTVSTDFYQRIDAGKEVESLGSCLFDSIYSTKEQILSKEEFLQVKERIKKFKKKNYPRWYALAEGCFLDDQLCVVVIEGRQWIFWDWDALKGYRDLVYYIIERTPLDQHEPFKSYVESEKYGDSYFPPDRKPYY